MTEIALAISCGYSALEVARRLGTKTRFVSDCLQTLRDELERLDG